MSQPLILVVMLIYFYVATEQFAKGNMAGFILWFAYGVANIGLAMQTK
jgi:hypothetical protein